MTKRIGTLLVLVFSLLLASGVHSAALSAKTQTAHESPTPEPGDRSLSSAAVGPSLAEETALLANDWPQLQRDPQRTGYSPETLGTNFKVAWTYEFQPDKVHPQVQAIIYEGRVFVGTEMGNLVALNAANGTRLWVYRAGGPVLASAAAGYGKVFFGAMDGRAYAINAVDGSLVWQTNLSWRHGFSTAPIIADGKVMLAGRDGVFYALNPETGDVIWQYDVGSPILHSPAWDQGKAFFGAQNMHLYAINTADGTLAWKSQKVPQMGFVDYWPVVSQGKLYVRPYGYGELVSADLSQSAQLAALAAYDANPGSTKRSMFIFDTATGQELPAVIHWQGMTMNGSVPPPCIDRDGYPVVQVHLFQYGWLSGWGRLNPTTRTISSALDDGTSASGNPADETNLVSCSNNLIISMQGHEHQAQIKAFDVNQRKWYRLPFVDLSWELGAGTMGGGGNPGSISNGMIYHVTVHTLVARSTGGN